MSEHRASPKTIEISPKHLKVTELSYKHEEVIKDISALERSRPPVSNFIRLGDKKLDGLKYELEEEADNIPDHKARRQLLSQIKAIDDLDDYDEAVKELRNYGEREKEKFKSLVITTFGEIPPELDIDKLETFTQYEEIIEKFKKLKNLKELTSKVEYIPGRLLDDIEHHPLESYRDIVERLESLHDLQDLKKQLEALSKHLSSHPPTFLQTFIPTIERLKLKLEFLKAEIEEAELPADLAKIKNTENAKLADDLAKNISELSDLEDSILELEAEIEEAEIAAMSRPGRLRRFIVNPIHKGILNPIVPPAGDFVSYLLTGEKVYRNSAMATGLTALSFIGPAILGKYCLNNEIATLGHSHGLLSKISHVEYLDGIVGYAAIALFACWLVRSLVAAKEVRPQFSGEMEVSSDKKKILIKKAVAFGPLGSGALGLFSKNSARNRVEASKNSARPPGDEEESRSESKTTPSADSHS